MAPRWKGKAAEAKAIAEPISQIVSQLQSSIVDSRSRGLLLGCSVLLAANPEQSELLNRACFGHPMEQAERYSYTCFARSITTTEKDKQWFQLSLEEAFYMCTVMKCINIVGEGGRMKNDEELWRYMTSRRSSFPVMFKAYCHLRMKNWVVRGGSQYGVDFVAYRHHPALVHSEYAVIVASDEDEATNGRLRVWSDFHCTLRLCGSVAKAMLVLRVERNDNGVAVAAASSFLEHYCVEERIVTWWDPKQSRDSQSLVRKESSELQT